jgi:purine-binding chemotaxis protein CheW
VNATQKLATFYVGGFYCGIHTKDVVELTKDLDVTPVPLSPNPVLGLLNQRGHIVTAINMRLRLSEPDRTLTTESTGIFYKHATGLFAFVVDRVGEIVELSPQEFESPPTHLTGPSLDFLMGVYKLPDSLLLVLDPQKLITGIPAV